jgi:GNAT superfamily N-acetyltransferase
MRTWLGGARKCPAWRAVPWDVFDRGHRELIARLWGLGRILVAADPEDDDVVWGWACESNGVLHWVYVKGPFRRAGIALRLLSSLGLDDGELLTTSMTRDLKTRFHGRKIVFDPYLLGKGHLL